MRAYGRCERTLRDRCRRYGRDGLQAALFIRCYIFGQSYSGCCSLLARRFSSQPRRIGKIMSVTPRGLCAAAQQVVTMTDRRAALAKRLGLQAPAVEANTNGTLAAAE
jgi:hypothetical protein